jgi:two-component system response regulator HydG
MMQPRLIALSGSITGSVFPITEKPLNVGRAADNDICIDDELVSRHHFSVCLKQGMSFLKDGNTRNGTWINGQAYFEKFLEEGDLIEGGRVTFLHTQDEVSPSALPAIINDETDRRRELETLRADFTVRKDAAVHYRDLHQVFVSMVESLNAFHDIDMLQTRLLDYAFEIIPAIRGAIWRNGPRISPDPGDFNSKIYRERGSDGDVRFQLSTKVLEEVYARRQPILSCNITPVLCAPLMFGQGIRGVMYMEGLHTQARRDARSRFEPEHLYTLRGIAELVTAALRMATGYESVCDERDLLKEERGSAPQIIGNSQKIVDVLGSIEKAAKHDVSVLILGETGTGKELVARRIHELSKRRDKAYVAINCGAIAETLRESEIFGHAKGAFTGATEARKGKLKQADGGTVFLDEVGDLSLNTQVALLRVLQEREFQPLGKEETIAVDVRVIAATNVDLDRAVHEGKFREDLLYRLNVFVIQMPPLRERTEDIPLLTEHLLDKYSSIRRVDGIAPDAMQMLMNHTWPGNVRELENVIQAALINGNSETLRLKDLPERVERLKPSSSKEMFKNDARRAARAAQREQILRRLRENGGDVLEAANWLGISKTHAYRLLGEES